MLAQRLISLAADTDHAGLRADATVLLAFARSVLERSHSPDWGIDGAVVSCVEIA